MSQKFAAFFDIDGTIWNRENFIPESTIRAIRGLREKGGLAFICSGRTRGYIQNPALFDIGFDGIISGCGTMIEYHDQVVFSRDIMAEDAVRMVETVRGFGMRPILEGKEYLYMTDREFGQDPYGKKLTRELGHRLLDLDEEWGKWDISKMSCATENSDIAGCQKALGLDYDFIIHDVPVVEIVPAGFSKASGIRWICEYLGVDMKNTYSFGDSNNDIDMFRATGYSIAMGNSSETAKAEAGYVTETLLEDGIWKACKHFELI